MNFKLIFTYILILVPLLTGCVEQPKNSTSVPAVLEESTIDKTSANARTLENFMLHAEDLGEYTRYFICYQETDGTLTEIVDLLDHKQPLITSDSSLYYILPDGGTPVITAVDYYGNKTGRISLDLFSFQRGWLLYSDESFIYGVGSNSDNENAKFFFKVNWELTEYQALAALPPEFRTINVIQLAADLGKAVGRHAEDIYVHRATVSLDANGMFYKLGLQISAIQENETTYGNLLFTWYNQDKDYINQTNPWFNRLDKGFKTASDPLPLNAFLQYLQTIGLSGIVSSTLSDAPYDYNLYWNGGMMGNTYPKIEDIPIYYALFKADSYHITESWNELPEVCFVVENWTYNSSSSITDSNISDYIATEILYISFP